MGVRGIRGATTVENDVPAEIHEATREMLEELLRANGISDFEEVGSIIFTTSPDLTSTFPAEAARALGMSGAELRRRNLNTPEDIPYRMPTRGLV